MPRPRTWNNGIDHMEYWNDGFKEEKESIIFSFLIRNIPSFQHSNCERSELSPSIHKFDDEFIHSGLSAE